MSRSPGYRGTGNTRWPGTETRLGPYEGLLVRRPIAYAVDLVVLSLLGGLLWLALGFLALLTLGLLLPLQAAIMALLPLTYHTLCIAWFSATPGMALLDVRIVSSVGGRPEVLQALLATVVFYVSMALTSGFVLLVPLFERRNRTLHDLVSGTQALRPSATAGR